MRMDAELPLRMPEQGHWNRVRFRSGDGRHRGPILQGRPSQQHGWALLMVVGSVLITAAISAIIVLAEWHEPGSFSGPSSQALERWAVVIFILLASGSITLLPWLLVGALVLGPNDRLSLDPDQREFVAERRWFTFTRSRVAVPMRHACYSAQKKHWQESRIKTDWIDCLLFPTGLLGTLIGAMRPRRKTVLGKAIVGRTFTLHDGSVIYATLTTLEATPVDQFCDAIARELS